MSDLLLKVAIAFFEKCDKKKEELLKDLKDTHVPQYLGVRSSSNLSNCFHGFPLQNLTKYVEEGKGEFFAGSSPTLADIVLITVFGNFKDARPKYSKLDNIYKKTLEAFPGIKKYLDTRPETPL